MRERKATNSKNFSIVVPAIGYRRQEANAEALVLESIILPPLLPSLSPRSLSYPCCI